MTDPDTLDTYRPTEASPSTDAVGPTHFGPYQLVRKLGEGGMGIVYEARKVGLDRRVALKVLTYFDGQAATRFLQEAKLIASIDHPNVVTCIDLGQHEGVPYLAMEYLEGETLRARMSRGPMTVSETVDLMLPVLSAIATAHDRDIVHRDIKPENIFLARRLRQVTPKVLDFGVAKRGASLAGPGITNTSAIIGTPGYMAPEQVLDAKRVTPASDQFALGSVLWAAVAGESLYLGDAAIKVLFAVVNEEPRSLHAARPELPVPFCDIVMRMLAREPRDRFPSVRDVGHALLPFASQDGRARWREEFEIALGGTQPVPRMPMPPKVSKTTLGDTVRPPAPVVAPPLTLDVPRPRRWPVVAAVAVVAAVLCAVALSRRERSPTRVEPPPVVTRLPASAALAAPAPSVAPAPSAAPAPSVAPAQVQLPARVEPAAQVVPTQRPTDPAAREVVPRPSQRPRLRHRNL